MKLEKITVQIAMLYKINRYWGTDVVYRFIQYSQLFGKKLNIEQIIKLCKSMNKSSSLLILSRLSYTKYNSEAMIKRYFSILMKKEYKADNLKFILSKDNYVLVSGQGILSAIKYVLLYSPNKNESITDKNDEDFFHCINLILALQETLAPSVKEDKSNIYTYFYRNALFNSNINYKTEMARSYFLYIMNKDNSIFKDLDNINIEEYFFSYYGYSLEEYFFVLMSIYNLYFTSNPDKISSSWIIDLDNYFKQAKFSCLDDIISDMTGSINDRKEWLVREINSEWNEKYFFDHPLYQISPNYLMSYTKSSMNSQLYNSFFFKIENCFDDPKLFRRYSGRLLEKYLDFITEDMLGKSNKKYNYIPEFRYLKRQKDSPDLMIKQGRNILVIEAKNRKVNYKGYVKDDDDLMSKSYQHLMVDPIKQAIDRMEDIVDKEIKGEFNEDDIYHFISITYNTLITLPPKFEERNLFKNESNLNIGSINNLSIEDYEVLLEYMSRKNSKSIFKFLIRLDNKKRTNSATYYMHKDHMHPRYPRLVNKNIKRIYNELKKYIKV